MTRKCHTHRPWINTRCREGETQNTDIHVTARTQSKQSNQPSHPHEDTCNCKPRKGIKTYIKTQEPIKRKPDAQREQTTNNELYSYIYIRWTPL